MVGTYFLLKCFFSLSQVLILGLSSLLLCFCIPSSHIAANFVSMILGNLYCLSGVAFLYSKYLSQLASHFMYSSSLLDWPSKSRKSILTVLSSWSSWWWTGGLPWLPIPAWAKSWVILYRVSSMVSNLASMVWVSTARYQHKNKHTQASNAQQALGLPAMFQHTKHNQSRNITADSDKDNNSAQ